MGAVRINQSRACVITEGEMLKFLGCLLVALGAVLSIPMEMTTMRPEATTEDTSGRLLSLPDPVKCAQRPKHFEHGGHSYWFSGEDGPHKLATTRLELPAVVLHRPQDPVRGE